MSDKEEKLRNLESYINRKGMELTSTSLKSLIRAVKALRDEIEAEKRKENE